MLILTEKPSVAKDFANALGCKFLSGFYTDGKTTITNCIGHLFRLQEPEFYDPKFKSWKEIPIIPEKFCYTENVDVLKQARFVLRLLAEHRYDNIIIATDADREGEIIARECLMQCGFTDFSKIKRFWVSQALTPEVIKYGIKNAKPFYDYNTLAKNGFGRQHADWLVGYNFTRYITVAANKKLPVGRVQTAILSAIDERCTQIENFKSEKYFEHYADFESKGVQRCTFRGIYFEESVPRDGKTEIITGFSDNSREVDLKKDIGNVATLIENKSEKKEISAPQLYNLNALQKDAFKFYGYSADETLNTVQKLYEVYKCVSYPRTPSRVMGSQNVNLCKNIWDVLSKTYTQMDVILNISDISLSNKRCFNDTNLEAHHALIPLKNIPNSVTESERNIYNLILNRFMLAFAKPFVFNKQTVILGVNNHKYKVTGREIIDGGWKHFENVGNTWKNNGATLPQNEDKDDEENIQDLSEIDFNSLILSAIETKEKWTKPPKHFNEASIIAFMENPKSEDENTVKLVGLGTQATRHTFIPKLKKCGYIEIQKKNIVITPLGKSLLNAVRNSPIKSIADVSETTNWERQLEENPEEFEKKIKEFVKKSVSEKIAVDVPENKSQILCPICGKEIRKGNKNWYCTGYKDGCNFKIWETISGYKLSEKDVESLCAFNSKPTSLKKFVSKAGKEFKARLYLDGNFEVKMKFD